MKILQVVTYISPEGAYGGPVRVAINQAKALTEIGHEVVVAAAAGGFNGPLPAEYDGFPVRLFPARRAVPKSGFAGLTSPGLFAWLATAVKGVDVVHIHLARDLVTLPAAALALRAKAPVVVQTHGMIDRTDKKLAGPLDRLLTKPVLRKASAVFYLTNRERGDLVEIAGTNLHLVHLPNGIAVPETRATEQIDGPQENLEVLFLARLHPRKRPLLFARAAVTIGRRFPLVRFSLVGPDEGEGAGVRATIAASNRTGQIHWSGSLTPDQTLARMGRASVYVLPSTDEPFPMAVLEAMSIGLPVVITESCGLASLVRDHQAGVVCDHSQEDFEKALERLLENANLRISMGARARAVIEETHSMSSIVGKLADIYRTVSSSQKGVA
ncbi:glycosyltransferase [Kocuria kalidii]|uniref:glycosyltransferase n=1 Tax=Kocuria kalidii TaxID=3376283 RepID=UPI003789CD51